MTVPPPARRAWTRSFPLAAFSWKTSFGGESVVGRADCAGDRDRGRDEHELVDAVLGAVLGELGDVENLAHGHTHDRNRDPVPGLVDARLGFVRPHLAAPGVGGERGELGALDPGERLEGEARSVAAGIAVPAPGLELRLHLAGAHDDEITAAQLDLLDRGSFIQI